MPGGRNIGVLGLDDTMALGLAKHLLARYFNAGLAAARPAKGRRKGEAYYATDTNPLYAWSGTAWATVAAGSSGHDPVTLAAAVEAVFGLSTQVLDFDTTQANKVLAGPASGGDAKPAMRLLVAADIPGGTAGTAGPPGPPGIDGVEGLDGFPIPGSAGATGAGGATGATGADGRMGPPGMDGEEGFDSFVPGPSSPGAAGAAGVAGPQGIPGIGLDGQDGQDAFPISGLPGAAGTPGASVVGSMGPPGIDGTDGGDGYPIPGPPGTAGAAGASIVGPMGMPGFDGSDGVDGVPIPGPAAAAGGGAADVTDYTEAVAANWDGATATVHVDHALDQLAERQTNGKLVFEAYNMWPSTTAGTGWAGRREYTTNDKDIFFIPFDPATDESCQGSSDLEVWDGGTVTVTLHWTTTAAAGTTVCFSVSLGATADHGALDAAFGTAVAVTDTVLAAGDLHICTTGAITVAGAMAGRHLQIRIMRDVSEDDCASDADLIRAIVHYNRVDAA